jgi:hypothetical protein
MISLAPRHLLTLLTGSLLLVACAASDTQTAPNAAVPSTTTEPASPPTTLPAPTSTVPTAECAEDESTAIAAVIEAQTSAISREDFAGALMYSSRTFRSNITTEQFERMIAYEYNFLLKNPAINVTSCQAIGESRDVIVELDSQRRHVMAYVLTPEDGRWRIDVAALLGEIEGLTA